MIQSEIEQLKQENEALKQQIGFWQIETEKLLCDALNRKWSAYGGFSIESLIFDIKDKLNINKDITSVQPELVVGQSYNISGSGWSEFRGIDWCGSQMSYHFKTSRCDRYILPEMLKIES